MVFMPDSVIPDEGYRKTARNGKIAKKAISGRRGKVK